MPGRCWFKAVIDAGRARAYPGIAVDGDPRLRRRAGHGAGGAARRAASAASSPGRRRLRARLAEIAAAAGAVIEAAAPVRRSISRARAIPTPPAAPFSPELDARLNRSRQGGVPSGGASAIPAPSQAALAGALPCRSPNGSERSSPHYESDNPGTKANLARILMQGKLGGTGKLVILPVDQGFEHGPARSFAPNPPAYDPHYHFQLAIDAGLSAYAAPLGFIEAGAATFAGAIPTILKVNSAQQPGARQGRRRRRR